MADINNQKKIGENLETDVAKELKKLLQQTIKPKAINIKVNGRSQNLGQSLGQKNPAKDLGEKTKEASLGESVSMKNLVRENGEQLKPGHYLETAAEPEGFLKREELKALQSKAKKTGLPEQTRTQPLLGGEEMPQGAPAAPETPKVTAEKTKAQLPAAEEAAPEDETSTKNQLAILKRTASKVKTEGGGAAVKDLASEASASAMQVLTAEALEQSWFNALETCGLTLLYVNFHLIMKYVACVSSFCEFGEEWTMKAKVQKQLAAAAGGPEAGESTTEQISSSALKWAEIIAILLVDILVITLIVLIFYAAYASLSWAQKLGLYVAEKIL